MILDLRDNPGGLLGQGIGVADLFLQNGTIVSVKGRTARNTGTFMAGPGTPECSCPLIVLINKNTASAAEILASALQENKRAVVLGQTSRGKGSVQAVEGIGGGYGIKITIARYVTPEGHLIQGRGVVPDVLIRNKLNSGFDLKDSEVSILTHDPAIEIALQTMRHAGTSDFNHLRSAAKKIVVGIRTHGGEKYREGVGVI